MLWTVFSQQGWSVGEQGSKMLSTKCNSFTPIDCYVPQGCPFTPKHDNFCPFSLTVASQIHKPARIGNAIFCGIEEYCSTLKCLCVTGKKSPLFSIVLCFKSHRPFLAPQDALEVMYVSESVSDRSPT